MKAAPRFLPLRALAAGLLLSFAVPAPIAAAGDAASRLKAGTADLDRVRANIAAANQRIDRDRAAQSGQRAAVEAAERKIADSQQALQQLAAEMAAQEARVQAAEVRRAEADARLVITRARLAQQVRSAYIAGQGGTTALLLSQQEPDRIGRLLTYFDHLNRASARDLDAIQTELAAVAAEQAQVETELEALGKLQATRKRALVALEADRAGRRQAVAALDERINAEGSRLKSLQDSEKDIQALLRKLKEALEAVPPSRPSGPPGSKQHAPKMRGVMAWPLRGAIIANYGDTKADSRLQWKGLWIAAAEGAAVRASAAGRVAYVGWLSSYGLIVVIEHDKGFFTLYGHNSTVARAAGDPVAAGDVIAAVGNTGGYERSGLYFEVRRGTDALDPRDWLGP